MWTVEGTQILYRSQAIGSARFKRYHGGPRRSNNLRLGLVFSCLQKCGVVVPYFYRPNDLRNWDVKIGRVKVGVEKGVTESKSASYGVTRAVHECKALWQDMAGYIMDNGMEAIVDDRLILGLAEAKVRARGELIAKIRGYFVSIRRRTLRPSAVFYLRLYFVFDEEDQS